VQLGGLTPTARQVMPQDLRMGAYTSSDIGIRPGSQKPLAPHGTFHSGWASQPGRRCLG